jgi:hypothetical protein
VDTDAIALKVKQEFAAKDQAKSEKNEPKQAKKALKNPPKQLPSERVCRRAGPLFSCRPSSHP